MGIFRKGMEFFGEKPKDKESKDKGEDISWTRNSIEAGGEEGRNLEEYIEELGFSLDDLANKDVLDLGSGPTARLSKELRKKVANARVISLSPDYSIGKHRQVAIAAGADNLVAGLGQRLPFPNESFDVVLSFHVLGYIRDAQDYKKILLEAARVLKKGGQARIGPIYHRPWDFWFNKDIRMLESSRTELNSLGVKIYEEELPDKFEHWFAAVYEPKHKYMAYRLFLEQQK